MEPQLDLLLVGHAVEDWVFIDDKEPRQIWGGIFNVARSFKSIARGFAPKVKIEPSAYGHAFIKIDRQNATKDVCASLNDRLREPTLVPSKWTHYCYLNALGLKTDWLKGGVLSADLCEGRDCPRSWYESFDYIFLSEEEWSPYSISRDNDKTIFISHSPEIVKLWNNSRILWESPPIAKVEKCNVLGVGDHFSAAFIFAKLYLHNHDEAAATFAIQNCREYLLSN